MSIGGRRSGCDTVATTISFKDFADGFARERFAVFQSPCSYALLSRFVAHAALPPKRGRVTVGTRADPPRRAPLTRLVAVDDDPYFLSLVQAAAEPLGIEVDACSTLAAGRLALAQPADLLLVDGILPDGTGEKLIDHVRRGPEPRPRIAFVSAFFKDLRTFQKLRGLGVELVLHKPISAARLRAELSGLIADRTSFPEPAATDSPAGGVAAKMRELGQAFAATFPKRR